MKRMKFFSSSECEMNFESVEKLNEIVRRISRTYNSCVFRANE
jgi:hypothetical protein